MNEDYDYKKQIGKGGFGTAWLAQSKKDKKLYVVKRITLDDDIIESTKREVGILRDVTHPNIVSYKESMTVGDRGKDKLCYLVMEYCSGGDLAHELEVHKREFILVPEQQVIDWTLQIAMALEYLHNLDIMHRDLKPANIFLTDQKIVKLGDFGLSRQLDPASLATTMCGTIVYIAPELMKRERYDFKIDIWSFGCTVYEMMTYELAINPNALARYKWEIKPMPKSYSKELLDVTKKMLTENPKNRPTATELLQIPFLRKQREDFDARNTTAPQNQVIPTVIERKVPIIIEKKNGEIKVQDGQRPNAVADKPEPIKILLPAVVPKVAVAAVNNNHIYHPLFPQDVSEEPAPQEYKPHNREKYTSKIYRVEPPPTFKPIPVAGNPQGTILKPAQKMKTLRPFNDSVIFKNVDAHAVEVAKEEHASFKQLIWHLIYAREITSELEKTRAIFLWLCSKDLSQLNFKNVDKDSPDEILMNLHHGQTTYSVVFETLCRYAGLQCKVISGYAKGIDYKPGMKLTGKPNQHSWNAVFVNGVWRLVDCHWASRKILTKTNVLRYRLDEYYFMPDPYHLIFSHFPDEPEWQLLEQAITLAEFESLIFTKSDFFTFGLQALSHREAVIRTRQEVTIQIGTPKFNKERSLAFIYLLVDSAGNEEYKSLKLNRYVMHHMVENVSHFVVRPPEKGSYKLSIFAKDLNDKTREGVYDCVCEYEVICESSPGKVLPYPPCNSTKWGAAENIAKYNLKPLQSSAIYNATNGVAEIRFLIQKQFRFISRIKSNEQDDKALAGYIFHRIVGDNAIFTITPPTKGEYGFEMLVNDPDSDGPTCTFAYQFLINCPKTVAKKKKVPTATLR